jgi:hypothetical protein
MLRVTLPERARPEECAVEVGIDVMHLHEPHQVDGNNN